MLVYYMIIYNLLLFFIFSQAAASSLDTVKLGCQKYYCIAAFQNNHSTEGGEATSERDQTCSQNSTQAAQIYYKRVYIVLCADC